VRNASGQARERLRFDLTMKKPGAEAIGSTAIRPSRGIRREHPSVLLGLSFSLTFLPASETLGAAKILQGELTSMWGSCVLHRIIV
jgi:hypothetical protein